MSDKNDVDIVFNCFEKTYTQVINENFIINVCQMNQFNFKNRFIIINNVNDRSLVEQIAKKLLEKGVIQGYYYVEDLREKACKRFGVSKRDFGKIYYYSDWAFVMLYIVRSPYFVHWDSHALLRFKNGLGNTRFILITSESSIFCDRSARKSYPRCEKLYLCIRNQRSGFQL